MKKTRVLVFMSLLVAMNVLLTHVVPVIQTDIVRVSFGFMPLSLSSMLFGPIIGGIGGAVSDLIGMVIAPKGPYFPGFTLNAFLTGMIYGLFLYKKPKTLPRIILAVLCISVFINLGLNTYWLTILTGKGFLALLPSRIVQNGITSAIQIVVIPLIWKFIGSHLEKEYLHQPV
jgi:ECF transporter S component (folate family)